MSDLQIPTPDPEKQTPKWVGFFMAAIVAYCIVGLSLGIFVSSFTELGTRLIDMGLGFVTGLFVPALAALLKK